VRYALLKVGLPTERGNTLECRRKFLMGCRGPPQKKHEARYICYNWYIANPARCSEVVIVPANQL